MASTTPDLHSNPWGLVVFRPLCSTLHLCARYFLNASIASDAFDSTYQTHETTDGLQSTKNCKVYPKPTATDRTPRVHHVFTTCSLHIPHVFPHVYHVFATCLPRIYHVFTTCLPRVYHVFTTCSPRVHHVFTTCSPRVHHVFTTCSPRVALGLVNQVTERDEGVVDREHFNVERHEARAFQCDRTT